MNSNWIREDKVLDENNIKTYIYLIDGPLQLTHEYPQTKIIIGEDNHAFWHVNDKTCYEAWQHAFYLGIKQ